MMDINLFFAFIPIVCEGSPLGHKEKLKSIAKGILVWEVTLTLTFNSIYL